VDICAVRAGGARFEEGRALAPTQTGSDPLTIQSKSCVRAAACLVALALAGAVHQTSAAGLAFTNAGPFEACLQAESETWLNGRAEDVVNGAESVKTLDDAKVAAWTVDTLKTCSAKGAAADAANEAAFAKYMAHWRDHLYELARVIRAKGGSD
jgi:hypothetical protein